MLKIIIKSEELYDESYNTFTDIEGFELELEHSLLSLSKWESKFQKPFLSAGEMSTDEIIYYVMCMIITPNITEKMVHDSSDQIFGPVNEYINSPESATTFGNLPKKTGPAEVITSELIYYWLVMFSIPFECESWHLNRLFSLIRICNVKNQPAKKMGRNELAQRNRELNERRKAELGTKG